MEPKATVPGIISASLLTDPSIPDVNVQIQKAQSFDQSSDSSLEDNAIQKKRSFIDFLDKRFGITKRKSSFSIEILAGITTFLSMAYILTVGAEILYEGDSKRPNQWSSLFLATCFSSIIGCLFMSLYANVPFAQAPGMGFIGQICTIAKHSTLVYSHEFTYENAMAIGFLYSIIMLLVILVPVGRDSRTGKCKTLRDKIYEGIPSCVRDSISIGIGLFICLIGMKETLVVYDEDKVLHFVNLRDLWALEKSKNDRARKGIITLVSFFMISIFSYFQVKGSIIIGILIGTLVGIPWKISDIEILKGKAKVSWKIWENFKSYFSEDQNKRLFLSCFNGLHFPENSIATVIIIVLCLGMVDLFGAIGTVYFCAKAANLMKDGKPISYSESILSESIASISSSLLGMSSATTFVESTTGIAAGGRTGLVALVVAICFLLSIFLLPIFAFIPYAASGSALIYVGALILSNITSEHFKNPKTSIPAFITIVMMPFSSSITEGIGLGIVSYVIIYFITFFVELIFPSCILEDEIDLLEVEEEENDQSGKFPQDNVQSGSSAGNRNKTRRRPKWKIGSVTGIISILFLVYFLAPQSI